MKYKSFLIFIVVLAAVLRLWNLGSFPNGLNADEASLGYNAYSLLQTGKDEYGVSWPLTFKSFGDYKPGLYVYLVMPLVLTLGLNEWAVRLPSAVLGIGTVVLIYYLGRKVFKSEAVGLVSAGLLAITPWHIHFSRGGWESNAATFFMTLGVYLFYKFQDSHRFFLGSMASFLTAMYLYQSPRLVVPVLVVLLFISNRGMVIGSWRKLVIPVVILVFLTIPLLLQLFGGGVSERFNGLSFLADSGPTSRLEQLRGEHINPDSKLTRILHNKVTAYTPEFIGHYLDHYSPDFWFINGEEVNRNRVPETGQFYLFEALFLVVAIYYLLRGANLGLSTLLIWVVVAPLASALTFQTPNALRSLNMVIPLTILMAFGGVKLYQLMRFKLVKMGLVVGLIAIASFESIHYLESYYIHYPKRYPEAWEYGFSEMVTKLEQLQGQFDKVVITDRYDQPYILTLFYQKYDPAIYQPQARLSPRDRFNFGTVVGFDKYEFRSFTKDEVSKTHKTLFIGAPKDVEGAGGKFDQINYPNGQPVFIFLQT